MVRPPLRNICVNAFKTFQEGGGVTYGHTFTQPCSSGRFTYDRSHLTLNGSSFNTFTVFRFFEKSVEVSAKLEPQEPLDLDSLADVAEGVKEAGLKASFSSGELNVKINLADIPLA
jgi:hypothetical protein